MQKQYGYNICFPNDTHIDLQNQKQGFRSELILNVYAIHLKKVIGAAATYGEQCGALALCTAAVSTLLSILINHLIAFPFTRPSVHLHFGQAVRI
jgi:hypothetical protein